MGLLSKKKIMEIYDSYIHTEEDIDFIVSELRSIYKKEHPPIKLKLSDENKAFTLNSDSWQVKDAKANGHYEFVKYEPWYEYEDMYIFKHTESGRQFAIDIRTLEYLIVYKDYQDYRFIYVGGWKDYMTLSI